MELADDQLIDMEIDEEKVEDETSKSEFEDSEQNDEEIETSTVDTDEEIESDKNDEDDNQETVEEDSSLVDLKGKLKADLVKIAENLSLDSKGTKPELIVRIYNSLSVQDLKNLLKEAGKPVSGKKSDLIDRLME